VSPKWKPSTLYTHRYYKRKYLDQAFEGLFLDEIEERHVQEWFNRITNTGGPGAANRCGEILRAMFNKAEQWGVRPEGSNPCLYIRKNKGRKCERFLSDQEFRRIGEVLYRHGKTFPLHCAAISLLILTGCRKSEITCLQWSEVRGRRLLLTDSKTGPRTVWLAEAAATILHALPRREKQRYVFWNPATQRPITDIGNLWSKLRDEAGLPGVRIHDLRHSFASHAAAHSETLPMIGKLLGHADVRTTTRYAHLDDGHVIEAARRIGDQIERNMSGSNSLNRNTRYDSGPLLHD
jgi:integrase